MILFGFMDSCLRSFIQYPRNTVSQKLPMVFHDRLTPPIYATAIFGLYFFAVASPPKREEG